MRSVRAIALGVARPVARAAVKSVSPDARRPIENDDEFTIVEEDFSDRD